MRRSSMTISPITSSATLRVLENGALNTGTPDAARGVDVDLIDADAEAADRDQPVGGSSTAGVSGCASGCREYARP